MIKNLLSKLFLLILILISITFFFQRNKNNPVSIIKDLHLQELPIQDIDSTVFQVNLLGFIPVGYAKLINQGERTFKQKRVLHLSAEASAVGFISRFFDARAQAESFIEKQQLHSLKFLESTSIPDKPKEEKEVIYDQEAHIMELEGVKRSILPNTQDPLSAMYFMRKQPLKIGKEFDININTNQKNYRLFAEVVKKEEHWITGKNMAVWVLKGDIRRRDKSPRHSTTMKIWLLDNPSKTPILIKVTTGPASITARLIDIVPGG